MHFKFYKCVSVQKVTVLFDLEGFNMRQYAWKPAAELVFTLLQIYEANYPEILKICFIFNGKRFLPYLIRTYVSCKDFLSVLSWKTSLH